MSIREMAERGVSILLGVALIGVFAMPAIIGGASDGGEFGAGLFVVGAVIGACGVAVIAYGLRP